MNPVDEYAQQVGHLFVEWRRAESKLRQLDGQFRATAAELQKAQTELETRPKAEPVATSRLCAWCDTAVFVAVGQTPVSAMGNHVATCPSSPLTAAVAQCDELERKLEYQRNEFMNQEARYRKLRMAAQGLRGHLLGHMVSQGEAELLQAIVELDQPTSGEALAP